MDWWKDPGACEELKKKLSEPMAEEYKKAFWTKFRHNEELFNSRKGGAYVLEKGADERTGRG